MGGIGIKGENKKRRKIVPRTGNSINPVENIFLCGVFQGYSDFGLGYDPNLYVKTILTQRVKKN